MEIGGDFSWAVFPSEPLVPWPDRAAFFARGRDCIVALADSEHSTWETDTLWIPDYFCEDVAAAWEKAGVAIARYPAMPGYGGTRPPGKAGDAVLVVNFFGVDDLRETTEVLAADGYCVIEDHTHDPAGPGAVASRAHYSFAALRKYLPLTDGAILWSNGDEPLPDLPSCRFEQPTGVAAMTLKAMYEQGNCSDQALKRHFRYLQGLHHEQIEAGVAPLSPSAWAQTQLCRGVPVEWREKRHRNARHLVTTLSGQAGMGLLFADWHPDFVPFCVPVLFDAENQRDQARQVLISEGIYPPVHWQLSRPAWPPASALSKRILSLPCDHRYGEADMRRIAAVLERYIAKS